MHIFVTFVMTHISIWHIYKLSDFENKYDLIFLMLIPFSGILSPCTSHYECSTEETCLYYFLEILKHLLRNQWITNKYMIISDWEKWIINA